MGEVMEANDTQDIVAILEGNLEEVEAAASRLAAAGIKHQVGTEGDNEPGT